MNMHIQNKQGGFLKLIALIIIVIFIITYFNISLGDVFNWIANLFKK